MSSYMMRMPDLEVVVNNISMFEEGRRGCKMMHICPANKHGTISCDMCWNLFHTNETLGTEKDYEKFVEGVEKQVNKFNEEK